MSTVDAIKIKMYNTGSVGDCLLLSFQKNGQTSFNMLIDCGGFSSSKADITACVADIKNSISNNSIDLVVLTHEHKDHASGFNQAKTLFDTLDFKRVWMSWAENDKDPIAKKLFREKGKKIKALTAALTLQLKRLQGLSRSNTDITGFKRSIALRKVNVERTLGLLHFESGEADKNAALSLTISDAMVYVKKKSKLKLKSKMFKKPGQVIHGKDDLPGTEGIKFFILGPPYDGDLSGIKNDEDRTEMYSLSKQLAMGMREMQLKAITDSVNGTSSSPFTNKYMAALKEKALLLKNYNSREMSWRQIEDDWLDSADELAIALNDFVNNTSLAFAIEFESSGKVLLFPADAQSGNWMSWHNEKVSEDLIKNGGKNADTLLRNTVFYKVGHHGSHNGTASKSGLDRMPDKGVVAYMPLIKAKVPVVWDRNGDNFPFQPLYKKLIEKTSGAVLRTDEGAIKDVRAKELREQNLTTEMQNRLNKASVNPLFLEWEVKG